MMKRYLQIKYSIYTNFLNLQDAGLLSLCLVSNYIDMKWIIIFFQLAILHNIYSQNTFSKIYDLDSNAIRNYTHDLFVNNDELYVYSTTFCDLDDTLDATCLTLTKLDSKGSVMIIKQLDMFNSYDCCFEGLTGINEAIVTSTYENGEKFQKVSLLKFDSDLNQLSSKKYEESFTPSQLINSGIECINGSIYIFGSIDNNADTPDSVHIIKTDLEGHELAKFYFSYGNSSLVINNLQATPDGNLAFILHITPPSGANQGFEGYQLMKIDTAGNVLYSFSFEDNGQQPNRMLNTIDNSYYFSSLEHPYNGWNPFSYGMINKMDANMDTLEWSLILPNNQLVDGRHYRMNDYIEASNGDIVACGMSYDNTDTELATGVPDKNSTWNGFIVRLSPEGEIKWLHLYKNPNDLLPNDEYGRFRPSLLNNIKELPDGRFIAAGNVFINNRQAGGINEHETEAFHLWLLMVDENGCLDGEDCEEIIRIGTGVHGIIDSTDLSWVYEEVYYQGSGVAEYGFAERQTKAYLLDDGTLKYGDPALHGAYISDGKMYYWDEYFNEYIMYYDFNSTTSYDIKYYDPFRNSEEIATVIIDSIGYRYFGNDSLRAQYIHVLNSGSFEDYPEIIYEEIGAENNGVKLVLGCGLCDFNPYITKLRCFSRDSMTYQFVSYACDSKWFTSDTKEINSDYIKIYPNPTTKQIWINGIDQDVAFELYSTTGKLIMKGFTNGKTIFIDDNGVFILRLKDKNNWNSKRVVKIE